MRGRATLILLAGGVVLAAALLVVTFIDSADLESYRRDSDDRHLTMTAMLGLGDSVLWHRTVEDPSQVTVQVWAWRERRARPSLGVPTPVRIDLNAPLGDRIVRDHRGRPVPER